jgi:hypothetical protein
VHARAQLHVERGAAMLTVRVFAGIKVLALIAKAHKTSHERELRISTWAQPNGTPKSLAINVVER